MTLEQWFGPEAWRWIVSVATVACGVLVALAVHGVFCRVLRWIGCDNDRVPWELQPPAAGPVKRKRMPHLSEPTHPKPEPPPPPPPPNETTPRGRRPPRRAKPDLGAPPWPCKRCERLNSSQDAVCKWCGLWREGRTDETPSGMTRRDAVAACDPLVQQAMERVNRPVDPATGKPICKTCGCGADGDVSECRNRTPDERDTAERPARAANWVCRACSYEMGPAETNCKRCLRSRRAIESEQAREDRWVRERLQAVVGCTLCKAIGDHAPDCPAIAPRGAPTRAPNSAGTGPANPAMRDES